MLKTIVRVLQHHRLLRLASFVFSLSIIPIIIVSFWFRKIEPVVYLGNGSAEKIWYDLISTCPLHPVVMPRLIPFAASRDWKNQPAGQPLFLLHASSWESNPADIPVPEQFAGRLPDQKKLLSIRYFAPVVPFWWEQKSIGLDELKNVLVLPLEGIRLPYKAIAVDDKYPGDCDYPLKKEIWLYYREGEDFLPGANKRLLTRWYENLPAAVTPKPEIVWIGATGDIMLERGTGDLLISKGSNAVFNDLLPLFQKQDLLLGNLEGAVCKAKKPAPKAFTFHFSPDTLPVLKAAGFDYFSIANNHTFDFGLSGFEDTLNHLKEAGIAYSGAGENLEAALRPWRTSIRGQSVSVFSLGFYPKEQHTNFNGEKETQATAERAGVLWATEATIEAIATTFSSSALDIIMIHGGEEYRLTPSPKQQFLYEKLINKGADLILGSHPHVLEGMKVCGDKLICFSMGNFLFNGMEAMPYAQDSLLLSLGITNNRITYLCYYPARIKGTGIARDFSGRISKHFIQLTRELN